MKKILVSVLTLYAALSLAACGTPAENSSLSAPGEGSSSSAGSVQVQKPQDSPGPERTFRIDTEKETVWYEGYSSERIWSSRYEYDGAGHLLSITPTDGEGGSAQCYDYDEAGNLLREYDSDEIFVTEYTYDDQGRLGSTTEKYDGRVLSVETYTYDSQDRKVMAMKEGEFQGDPGSYTTTTVYSYDDQGLLVKEASTSVSQLAGESANQSTSRTEYSYRTDGQIESKRVFADEDLQSETTYTYDQEKLSIQETTYEPSGEMEVINFAYDDQGNVIQKVTLRLSSKWEEKSRVTNEYTYVEVES